MVWLGGGGCEGKTVKRTCHSALRAFAREITERGGAKNYSDYDLSGHTFSLPPLIFFSIFAVSLSKMPGEVLMKVPPERAVMTPIWELLEHVKGDSKAERARTGMGERIIKRKSQFSCWRPRVPVALAAPRARL